MADLTNAKLVRVQLLQACSDDMQMFLNAMVIITQAGILLGVGGGLKEFGYIMALFNQAGVNALENIKCHVMLQFDSKDLKVEHLFRLARLGESYMEGFQIWYKLKSPLAPSELKVSSALKPETLAISLSSDSSK